MDERQQIEFQLQQQLEAERLKLTEAQRASLDRYCDVLKTHEIYKTEHAIEAAELIRAEDGEQLRSDLQNLIKRLRWQDIEAIAKRLGAKYDARSRAWVPIGPKAR